MGEDRVRDCTQERRERKEMGVIEQREREQGWKEQKKWRERGRDRERQTEVER